jgi:hypothetical protein
VSFFALLGQTHDELKGEFIVATTAGIRTVGFATRPALTEPGIDSPSLFPLSSLSEIIRLGFPFWELLFVTRA